MLSRGSSGCFHISVIIVLYIITADGNIDAWDFFIACTHPQAGQRAVSPNGHLVPC